MNGQLEKRSAQGLMTKLLKHTRDERGMTLLPYESRCIRAGEIHELVTTNERELGPGARVDSVGFLGFVEFTDGGVIDVGDQLVVGTRVIGPVVGFDDCHYPNHYNILVGTAELLTGETLGVEDPVLFRPTTAGGPAT